MTSQQAAASALRSAKGGVVKVRVAEDRVLLGGAAVTVVRGELRVEGAGS